MHQFFSNIFQNNRRPRQRQSRTRPTETPTPTNANNGTSNTNSRTNRNQGQSQSQRQQPMNPLESFAQQFQANFQQNPAQPPAQSTRAAPPAHSRAIRQLPTVSVTPEDLVDENNRECCICFEEHSLTDKVTRLPCAHIYHPQCITEWLNRHCTCPQCRYELPTDSVVYERERKERMKNRKPRYARYELERMSIKELKGTCVKLSIEMLPLREKKDFVDALIASGKIIMIAAPEPVEYQCIEIFRSMGVGQLKRAMADAGVFFDGKDVVEKEDMVQIFVNSGRIVLVEKGGPSLVEKGGSASTRSEYLDPYGNAYSFGGGEKSDDGDEACRDETKRARMDEDGNSATMSMSMGMGMSSLACTSSITTVMEINDECDVNKCDVDNTSKSNDSDNDNNSNRDDDKNTVEEDGDQEEEKTQSENDVEETNDIDNGNDVDNREGGTAMSQHHSAQEERPTNISPAEEEVTTTARTAPQPTYGDVDTANEAELPSFATRSVGELRQLATSLDVDLSGCIEKREIVALISAAIVDGGQERNGSA